MLLMFISYIFVEKILANNNNKENNKNKEKDDNSDYY